MDDEQTDAFREPCSQCSAVDWGVSDEGSFYCKSCHTVIERTREVEDHSVTSGSSRVSTLTRKARTKQPERGRRWAICEAFQFILRNQADALVKLGASSQFKDSVLCPLWRLYLQKSRLANAHNPERSAQYRMSVLDSGSGSAADWSGFSSSETDGDSVAAGAVRSDAESSDDWSLCSGPLDTDRYRSTRLKRTRGLMSMRKTLALVHLALVWSRETLTLSDLLRLVGGGHVPYVNAYRDLPEEMQLQGAGALLLRAESIPAYQEVHKEAESLRLLLQLPAFPPITRQSLLHPALLSLRYLTDANLPDELHLWVCRMMDCAAMADETHNTCSRFSGAALPRYDLQAAALIIVTMKLLFGLDDHTEWALSSQAGGPDASGEGGAFGSVLGLTGDAFDLRAWYQLLQPALSRAQRRRDGDTARKQWKTDRLLSASRKERCIRTKKKRVSDHVRVCFEKLSSRPAGVERVEPSSFRFCWGDEDGADGPSLHQKTLDRVVTLNQGVPAPLNATYWHPALRRCKARSCTSHYSEVEPTLPRSFAWLLQLFCFLLDVKPALLYEEVLTVERRVFGRRTWTGRGPWTGRRPCTRSQPGQKSALNTDP
ncbi:TATA box-binding protein-associated factor RNA polymerase I subunit B [Brachionichthys hirsutus]|uniref:TATA box-binding protein-associated factor RNA polymerase I subunit B n=1 Tax=Brachionichthys hirsutus TaxID=412623 RepID=UPI003604FDEC